MMVAIHPISALESIPIRESRATLAYAGCAVMGGNLKPRAVTSPSELLPTTYNRLVAVCQLEGHKVRGEAVADNVRLSVPTALIMLA